MPHSKTRKLRIPSEPNIPPVKQNISPGEDYYMFINSNWLSSANMPSYLSSYGVSEEIEEIVNAELLKIVYDCRQHYLEDTHPSNNEYLLGILTESIINTKNKVGNVKFLENIVSSLKCIRDKDEIASTLGNFIRYRVPTVINLDIAPTETDSEYLRVILTPNIKLGLPDLTYYQPGFAKTRLDRRHHPVRQRHAHLAGQSTDGDQAACFAGHG